MGNVGDDRAESPGRESLVSDPAASAGTMHVVIAEDDHDLALELEDVVRTEGHEAHVAADLETAVRAVVERAAELLLVDLDARSMNGLDVIRWARARRGSVLRIVAVTGNRDIGREALEAGADEMIVKPFGRAVIQRELGTTLALGTLRG